jgi:hypothetical protein
MSSLFMSHFSDDIASILSRDGTSYTGTNRNRRQCLPKFFFNDHGADQLSTLPYIKPSHSHRGVASDMGEIYVTQARLSLFITGSLHAAAPLLHLQSCFYTRGAARQGMLHDCYAMWCWIRGQPEYCLARGPIVVVPVCFVLNVGPSVGPNHPVEQPLTEALFSMIQPQHVSTSRQTRDTIRATLPYSLM